MCDFSEKIEAKSDRLLQKYNFADLREILYNHGGSQSCIAWMQKNADQGHGPLLYMLVRNSYHQTGAGQLEIVGENLTLTLERIMKFLIRFEQDIACFEEVLGHQIDPSLCANFKKKIHVWFKNTIRGHHSEEFKQALNNTKAWFNTFSDTSKLTDNSDSDFYSALGNNNHSPSYISIASPAPHTVLPLGGYEPQKSSLPSPLWVHLLTWGSYLSCDPNTITYKPVDEKFKNICDKKAHQEEFAKIRQTILKKKLQELENTGSAQAFITQLNFDPQDNNNSSQLMTYVPGIAKFAGKAALSYLFGPTP